MKHLIFAPRLIALAALATLTASAESFVYTTIVVPGGYGTDQASGINDSGEIVGDYGATPNAFGGFLDNHGSFSTISLGPYGTQAFGVNNSGQIVGLSFTSMGGYNAFLDTNGTPTTLNIPGSTLSQATGINDSGEVVGYYGPSTSPYYFEVFVYKKGNLKSIFVPGSFGTQAFGVNNAGQIVGIYLDSVGHTHAYLYSNGSFTPITVPGDPYAYATGINNRGEIVGYESAGFSYEGFLDNHGTFTTFSVPGSSGTEALGINDQGQIVGFYFDSQGGMHAFEASPVPEPASAVLIAVTLVALAAWRLRRLNRVKSASTPSIAA
jgi:probable HAF family extracellular repeat protein